MDTLTTLVAVLSGLALRLAIPILGTILLVYLLRKLDTRWQAESEQLPTLVNKIECWNIKGCSEEQRKHCAGATSSLPCWQVHRQPNGYLQEKCVSCEVFTQAPIPALTTEPRRM